MVGEQSSAHLVLGTTVIMRHYAVDPLNKWYHAILKLKIVLVLREELQQLIIF